MEPRLRLALALLGLVVAGILATLAGERRTRQPDDDPRRSTFVHGPAGASAWAEALERLGTPVERVRTRERLIPAGVDRDVLVALLDPGTALDPFEGRDLAAHAAAGGDVLIAGHSASAAMRCLGYDVERSRRDSARAAPPGRNAGAGDPWVRATLVERPARVIVDTVEAVSGVIASCTVPEGSRVDTLLVAGGRPVVVEIRTAPGGRAVLAADGGLFSNRRLRATAAGPFAVGLAAGRYEHIRVDELHHGYGAGGNMAGALLSWSAESPWGWLVWQAALVGVLAILAGAVRFGPPRPLGEHRRRSALEHVRALATALAASRGHDVAIRLLVHGLRRRLAKAVTPAQADPHAWIMSLTPHLRTQRAQAAAAALAELTLPPQPAGSVLRAANAVEDLWEELRP
jgi:hypothetical protein